MSAPSRDNGAHPFTGIVIGMAGATLFGAKAIVIKLGLEAGASVEQLLIMRMAFSLPIYLGVGIMALRRFNNRPPLRSWLLAASLGVLSYHVCAWLDFQGLRYISAQLERLILFIYPTIVALISWAFLKERLTWRHAIALCLTYGGVWLLFGQERSQEGGDIGLGAALVFASATFFAIYMVASKGPVRLFGSALFTSITMSSAAITLLAHTGVQTAITGAPPFTPAIIGYGAALAIFCTVAPSFLMNEAIARLGPPRASAVAGIGPVATAGLAVLVLGEDFGLAHAGALVLTMMGVAILSGWSPHRTLFRR